MTGREKLIEWAKNATVEELSGVFGCPQCFELEPHDCVRCFDTNCCDCWKQALEREYEEEEK